METYSYQFISDLKQKGVIPGDDLLSIFNPELVDSYYKFLLEKNLIGGFFSKGDSERIVDRHLYESMVFIQALVQRGIVSRETEVADAGSGPGLPGFLLASLRSPPRLTLIDSSRRRLGLLEKFVESNSELFSDVRFVYGRLEELKLSFDLVVSRALIPFPFCAELACNLVKNGGLLASFLGAEPRLDSRTKSYLKRLGFVSHETVALDKLDFLGKRSVYLLNKNERSGTGYPRRWAEIKKEMRQWER